MKQHILTFVPYEPGQPMDNGIPVFTPDHRFPFEFNISFMANGKQLIEMGMAVERIQTALLENVRSLATQWLFPELEDLELNPAISITPSREMHRWVDNGLNREQKVK